MADQVFGGGMFGEPYATEIANARTKQALAQLLQQTYGGQPQGQMVSGHYVKPNWTQQLSQLASVLAGAKLQSDAAKGMAETQGKYSADQSHAVGEMHRLLTGGPRELAGPPAPGETMGVDIQPPNPIAAEQYGQTSQYPQTQALAKTLMEERMKRIAAMQKELAGRVGINDVPGVFAGQTSGLQPRQGVQMVDGVSVAVPSEFVPGGQAPQRVGEPWRSTTVTGADGRPMAAQENPLTGKKDVLDKAPRTSVSVNTGKPPEDKYIDTSQVEAAKGDRLLYDAAATADKGNKMLARVEDIIKQTPPSGGPLAERVVWTRNLLSQLGIPLDRALDETNARLTAEASTMIASMIISGGRGITDEEGKKLEQTFPGFRNGISTEQLPAFIKQLRAINNAKIEGWQERYKTLPDQYKTLYPATFGPYRGSIQQAPDLSNATVEELERRREELLRKRGGQ